MFIFPLGLGSRLPGVPLMCLLLSASIFGYSLFSFPVIEKYEAVMKEKFLEPIRTSSGRFFEEFCELRLKDESACRAMRVSFLKEKSAGDKELAEELKKDSNLLKSTAKMLKIAEDFGKILKAPEAVKDPEIRSMAGFQNLTQVLEQRREQSEKTARQLGLLNGGTLGFITLLKAQFSHSGWFHLLSNLLVLLLLGVYVESRAGAVWFFGIFLASGMLGMLADVALTADASRVVLGASAGVSGVMGAFLAFFFFEPMKVWLSYLLFFNRVIFMPAYLVLGPLFIAHDVVGALSTSDGVAHVAHLGGLVIGFALGRLQRSSAPVEEGMLYADEAFFASKLNEIPAAEKRLEIARLVLSWNPNNLVALRAAVLALVEMPFEHEPKDLHPLLTSYLALTLRSGKSEEALSLIQSVPVRVALASQIYRLSLKNRLRLAEFALEKGDWLSAMRVYDSLLVKTVKPELRGKVLKSVELLYTHLESSGTSLEPLKSVRLSSELKDKIAA